MSSNKRELLRVIEILLGGVDQLSETFEVEGLGAVSGFSRGPELIGSEGLEDTSVANSIPVVDDNDVLSSAPSSGFSLWTVLMIIAVIFVVFVGGCCFAYT